MGLFSEDVTERILASKLWRYYIWVGKCVFEAGLLSEF